MRIVTDVVFSLTPSFIGNFPASHAWLPEGKGKKYMINQQTSGFPKDVQTKPCCLPQDRASDCSRCSGGPRVLSFRHFRPSEIQMAVLMIFESNGLVNQCYPRYEALAAQMSVKIVKPLLGLKWHSSDTFWDTFSMAASMKVWSPDQSDVVDRIFLNHRTSEGKRDFSNDPHEEIIAVNLRLMGFYMILQSAWGWFWRNGHGSQ